MSWELSQEADYDLEAIFEYTFDEFGEAQAIKYLNDFEELFEKLSQNPLLGRERNEIRSELRSVIQLKHVVFYRLIEENIRIVRILHGSMDIPSHFGNK